MTDPLDVVYAHASEMEKRYTLYLYVSGLVTVVFSLISIGVNLNVASIGTVNALVVDIDITNNWITRLALFAIAITSGSVTILVLDQGLAHTASVAYALGRKLGNELLSEIVTAQIEAQKPFRRMRQVSEIVVAIGVATLFVLTIGTFGWSFFR